MKFKKMIICFVVLNFLGGCATGLNNFHVGSSKGSVGVTNGTVTGSVFKNGQWVTVQVQDLLKIKGEK